MDGGDGNDTFIVGKEQEFPTELENFDIAAKSSESEIIDLGKENAGKTVTLKFDATSEGTWDSSGSLEDFFKVNANGNEVINDSSFRGEQTHSYSIELQLDENGQVALDFQTDVTGSDESISLSNFNFAFEKTIENVDPGEINVAAKSSESEVIDLGAENAGKTVTISFDGNSEGTWDTSGGYKDFFNVNANGEQVISDSTYRNSTSRSYSIEVIADENGQIALDFHANTTGSDESISIDNFNFSFSEPADIQVVTGAEDYKDNTNYGQDQFRGGDGNDTILLKGGADLNLSKGFSPGHSIENIKGNGDSIIHGNNENNYMDFSQTDLDGIAEIRGGGGNDHVRGSQEADVINGGKGDDRIFGNDGNDTISGGKGNDYLDGGEGNDTFIVGKNGGQDHFRGGEGNDTIKVQDGANLNLGKNFSSGHSVENIEGDGNTIIIGDKGNDHLDFSQTDLDGIAEIRGGGGNDYIKGSQEADVINGGKGDDRIFGNDGNDTISGGKGNDYLDGGEGNDTFIVGKNGGQDYFRGGEGHDVIEVEEGANLNLGKNFSSSNSVEEIKGNGDTIISGDSDNDYLNFAQTDLDGIAEIRAGKGNDRVWGSQEDDVIRGGRGEDYLQGEAGDDQIFAGKDNDRLRGGSGDDILDGGKGIDTAEFTGNLSDYEIKELVDGRLEVTDLVSGRDGQDLLENIENLKFGGRTYNMDQLQDHIEAYDPPPTNITFSNTTINQTIQDLSDSSTFSLDGENLENLSKADIGVGNGSVSMSSDTENNIEVTLDSSWNSLKNILVENQGPVDVKVSNFVHADIELGNGNSSTVIVEDAKRGNITTGDGNDNVDIDALSNGSGWSNEFTVNTNEGNDFIEGTGSGGHTSFDIDSGSGNDTVTLDGDYAMSEVDLGSGNDTFNGGNGNDSITAGDGNDTIDGGTGVDSLELSGDFSEYDFYQQGDQLSIVDSIDGRDGKIIVTDVENFNFQDTNLTLGEISPFADEIPNDIDFALFSFGDQDDFDFSGGAGNNDVGDWTAALDADGGDDQDFDNNDLDFNDPDDLDLEGLDQLDQLS